MGDTEDCTTSSFVNNEKVYSKAVVKYSVRCPARFTKLQCNTDLNLPPSNWLSSSIDSYGLQHVLCQPQGFTSFRMAHMFPDCVGEVDVVSDAENIKNLLKIPYHKGSVSMMVHRVENTLLLDDFDVYKHILRTAETEWEWLRRFFFENFKNNVSESPYDSALYFKNKSRKSLKQKSLVSKFLYHSLIESEGDDSLEWDNETKHLPVQGPILPEPSPTEEVPDPTSHDHKYNRNVIWTFEDIQMLLGTDMPIFGGGTHPCISLRLRDMSKPINVLTGIDYWLDNLMSNVPEVVMCYHLNGIVQKYELIKTEDLPRLDDSKFSPKVIREVAKSILSFLKSNATRAGHTYWLFKPKDQDVVKLYDLSSLCSKYMVEKDENPFTVPVAMLLYRVARNMKHSHDRLQPGTIRMLLKNCVKLLPEEKYPEIVTSSHYMLSDLFLPAGTNPQSPDLEQTEVDDAESVYDDDLSENNEKDSATKVLMLDSDNFRGKFTNHYEPPPPITGSVEERCMLAIHHAALGLDCLKHFACEDMFDSTSDTQKAEVPLAKPYEPIPMPYSKLSGSSHEERHKKSCKKRKEKSKKKFESLGKEENFPNALLLKNIVDPQPLPKWEDSTGDNISWKDHLKILLYEKVVLVYATFAEQFYRIGQYGNSLRNLGLLVRSHQILSKLLYSSNTMMQNLLLGRAGDCCIMIVQNWDKLQTYRDQFYAMLDEDLKMIEQLEQDERLYGVNFAECALRCVLLPDIRTIEQMLVNGVEFYNEALKYGASENILPRLGNGLNELGTFYLNRGRNSTDSLLFDSCTKAEKYLKRGLETFEKIKDDKNMALLYTNIGHLHRTLAHANSPTDRCELTQKEKLHYNKAFINYKKALQVLGDRSQCPGIWDVVKWDLCTALFTMGTILHDHPNPSLTRAEAEKEVTETFHQALKYCDLDENHPRFPLYQFRAALIHYRLGSLYHSSLWYLADDLASKRTAIHLAKFHYEKASSLFFDSTDPVNCLTAQMQRFALFEYLAENTTVAHLKMNHLKDCLKVLIDVQPMLQLIDEQKVDTEDKVPHPENKDLKSYKSLHSLVGLLKERIQCVLRLLLKLCLAKPSLNKDCCVLAKIYKDCYAFSLSLDQTKDFCTLVSKINNILLEIQNKLSIFL